MNSYFSQTCMNCIYYGCWKKNEFGENVLVNPCANCSLFNVYWTGHCNPRYGRREDPIYYGQNECGCLWDCRHPVIRTRQNNGNFD